ncbi:Crp/Fnr family transcriptional regulator [Aquincola sp. S2]|uniref:Crp/Fnr family transcriptional regulator n=1 Tax=Pseudaquabacterium terrae TaxID=2732868 RepID=A0ABX2EE60_9BURK|nr:Crp/Fnr family transcriptional regulator [Aquabacterium terrae]NRF66915.1 Crp/Fnr family transcriptional regulator [Aquabacterium terrae]
MHEPDADPMRLPEPVQALLLAQAHRRKLAAGESLFLAGSMPDALFGVVSGCLCVSQSGADGREAVIALLEPGHWFGEVSLLIGRERVYDTCATQPSEVAVLGAAEFHRLIATEPGLLMAFTQLVCRRLRAALAWIDDALLQPLPVRLAQRLVRLAQEAAAAGDAALPVSQEQLAAMLGVSRQTVNRQLQQWQRIGALRLRYGRIEVVDAAGLTRAAAAADGAA